MRSYCVAEDNLEVACGTTWHLANHTSCPECGTPFCSSCFRGCPRCGFGKDLDRRDMGRAPVDLAVGINIEEER